MNNVILNGLNLNVPLTPETQFQDLISYVKSKIDTNFALISSIKIDGNEVDNTEDETIATTLVSSLNSIEIFTTHPREVVDDTLQNLMQFSKVLEDLSIFSADQINQLDFNTHFTRLIDGISTYTQAIAGVKNILKLGLFNKIQVLEADLLSILKDVLKAQEDQQFEYMAELLKSHLPENLRQWREKGLPTLIRSRDS